MINSKSSFRKQAINDRSLIPKETKIQAEYELLLDFKNNKEINSYNNILLFASYDSEIDTYGLINYFLDSGKNVYLPKIIGEEMFFFKINSLNDLKPGFKGILEPNDNSKNKYFYSDNDLIIMPGLAFDKEGYRLGYGRGFYDRFLYNNSKLCATSIAIGFKSQLYEHIPHDDNDVKPNKIYLY